MERNQVLLFKIEYFVKSVLFSLKVVENCVKQKNAELYISKSQYVWLLGYLVKKYTNLD